MKPARVRELVQAYAAVARPLILKHFPKPNSCIAATRATIDTLRCFGLRGRPAPVSFTLNVASSKMTFMAGLTPEHKAEVIRRADRYVDLSRADGTTWAGHVLALIEGTWLVDAAFDQALYALAPYLEAPAEPHIFSTFLDKHIAHNFELRAKGILNSGFEAQVHYLSSGDEGFREMPHWQPSAVAPLVREIRTAMSKKLKGTK